MTIFKDRVEAGQKLAQRIIQYLYPVSNIPTDKDRDKDKDKDIIIYALPRGGVVLGAEIAQTLGAELDLVIVRKIGHPYEPEYAIGVIAEDGDLILNPVEFKNLDKKWLEDAKKREQEEAKRRREKYLGKKPKIDAAGKIAIIVDDGVATGLSMELAVKEIKHKKPKEIIIAVPVIPKDTAIKLEKEVDKLITLSVEEDYAGAVSAYYKYFPQVEDEEVIEIMNRYR